MTRRHVPIAFNRKPGIYVQLELHCMCKTIPIRLVVVGEALPVELCALGNRYELTADDAGNYRVSPPVPAMLFELTVLLTPEPFVRPWWAFWRHEPAPSFQAALIGEPHSSGRVFWVSKDL